MTTTCCKGQGAGPQCQNCTGCTNPYIAQWEHGLIQAPVCATAADEPLVWPVLDLPAQRHCERIRQPCATPFECAQACRLITENRDGSDRDARPARSELLRGDIGTVVSVITAVALLAAVYQKYFGG